MEEIKLICAQGQAGCTPPPEALPRVAVALRGWEGSSCGPVPTCRIRGPHKACAAMYPGDRRLHPSRGFRSPPAADQSGCPPCPQNGAALSERESIDKRHRNCSHQRENPPKPHALPFLRILCDHHDVRPSLTTMSSCDARL